MNIQTNTAITDIMNQINIMIIGSGYVKTDTTWYGENICSPYSRLYYVENGEGILEYGDTKIVMYPGHVYLIPTGLLYNYRCENSVHKLFFHINIFKPNGYDLLSGADKCAKLPIPIDIIKRLIKLYKTDNYFNGLLLKQEIYKSLAELLQLLNVSKVTNINFSAPVQQTIDYIQDNLSLQLNNAELAKQLFISESALSKSFKAETGITIGKYIDDLIFFKAENLLQKSNLTIRQISDKLGFCDQFYFSRRFSQKYNETPLKYRKRMKFIHNM